MFDDIQEYWRRFIWSAKHDTFMSSMIDLLIFMGAIAAWLLILVIVFGLCAPVTIPMAVFVFFVRRIARTSEIVK